MTEIILSDNYIEVDGHAGYSNVGSDIVCSGISTITYTIAEWCLRNDYLFEKLNINMDNPGYARIDFATDDGSLIAVIEALTIGYELLADQFPDYVSFSHI